MLQVHEYSPASEAGRFSLWRLLSKGKTPWSELGFVCRFVYTFVISSHSKSSLVARHSLKAPLPRPMTG